MVLYSLTGIIQEFLKTLKQSLSTNIENIFDNLMVWDKSTESQNELLSLA